VEIKKLVGRNIRHYREKLGVSQETFAYQSGMNSDYIAKCERGEMNITLENLARLSKGLKVSPAKLFLPVEE
jgi:transcriptional regulator with XRE-family HTH domain